MQLDILLYGYIRGTRAPVIDLKGRFNYENGWWAWPLMLLAFSCCLNL